MGLSITFPQRYGLLPARLKSETVPLLVPPAVAPLIEWLVPRLGSSSKVLIQSCLSDCAAISSSFNHRSNQIM
jgi:hypothetical protein